MAHTADAFLVDAAGRLRHRIWFGAGPAVIAGPDQRRSRPRRCPTTRRAPGPDASSTPLATPAATPTPAATLGRRDTTPAATPGSSAALGSDHRSPDAQHDRHPRRREPARGDGQRPGQPRAGDSRRRRPISRSARATIRRCAPIDVDRVRSSGSRRRQGAYVVEWTFPVPARTPARSPSDGPAGRIGAADFPFSVVGARLHAPIGDPGAIDPHADRRRPNAGENLYAASRPTSSPTRGSTSTRWTSCSPRDQPFVLHVLLAGLLPDHGLRAAPEVHEGDRRRVPGRHLRARRAVRHAQLRGPLMPELRRPASSSSTTSRRRLRDPRRAVRLRRRRDGTIVASFELIVGSDEIRAAIRAASARAADAGPVRGALPPHGVASDLDQSTQGRLTRSRRAR